MDASRHDELAPTTNVTRIELRSDREVVVTRWFDAPARVVFEAWSKPELFKRWWVPKSMGMNLLSCALDVRVGGKYRLEFAVPGSAEPFAFFGTYKDVILNSRIVWTNEESPDGAISTVTLEEKGGKTLLVFHEIYPTKEALDEAGIGAQEMLGETFGQLDELLAGLSPR